MISEVVKNTIDNYLNDVIEVNGVKKPIKNSLGDYISTDIASIENFYKWFGDSKMVDSQNRPLVCYHISSKKIDVFNSSPFGKMGEGFIHVTQKKDRIFFK